VTASGSRAAAGGPARGRDGAEGMHRWLDVERFRCSGVRVVELRRVERPAVVLGSTQRAGTLDAAACAAAGVDVVRRRSGGGAVLVRPADPLWCDVWLPRHDPLWDDDVTSAPHWVGEWWSSALRALGVDDASVHRGGMMAGPLSDVVCFAGIGPGEVTVAGRKLVGVAQWRCRQGGLFHCAAYRRWEPSSLLRLLAGPLDAAAREPVYEAAVGLEQLLGHDEAPARIVDALVDALPPGATWELVRD